MPRRPANDAMIRLRPTASGRSRRTILMASLMAAGCVGSPPPELASTSLLRAADVGAELQDGAVMLDVRGSTERQRDGVTAQPSRWIPFGPDHWRGRPGDAETQAFLGVIAAELGPPMGQRLMVLCSVGVRSAAAASALGAAGYDAENIMDGWLGNSQGTGLRHWERTSLTPVVNP